MRPRSCGPPTAGPSGTTRALAGAVAPRVARGATAAPEAPNGIAPAVHYGAVPAGATQTTAPEPLARGTSYDLVLLTDTSDDAEPAAVRSFTP